MSAVQSVLAATANPEAPNEVDVSQPSATLVARADAESALNGLFLGLGAVALLVGAVGVANIMVISVLERRSEEIAEAALGATRAQIRTQFLCEAMLLALIGGAVGVATGAFATAIYAQTKGWTVVIPTLAWAGGLAAALLIGALAGMVPALRAARLAPTEGSEAHEAGVASCAPASGPRGRWLVDAHQIAGRVAHGEVPRAPRLLGGLLHDLGVRGAYPLERGVEVVGVEVNAVQGALGEERGERVAVGGAAAEVVRQDDRDAGLGGCADGDPAEVLAGDVVAQLEAERVAVEGQRAVGTWTSTKHWESVRLMPQRFKPAPATPGGSGPWRGSRARSRARRGHAPGRPSASRPPSG